MKSLITILMVLALAGTLSAQSYRSDKQSYQIASSFAGQRLRTQVDDIRLSSTLKGAGGQTNVYIYNIGNQGFVIVSGNTVLSPVIGYSFDGTMPPYETLPDHIAWWIGHYSEMIDYAVAEGVQPTPEVQQQWDMALQGSFPSKNAKTVDPLITTFWNQDCYYNEYCPSTGGGWWGGPCGHVYAGCVACAMSQVMKYWNHPQTGFGSHSYVHSDYGEQSANFAATTYQWDDMPTQIYSHNDAIATLMYHCGVSVNMNYGADGSGAQSSAVETAARSYFGYCGAKYREKDKYEESEWIGMLKAELDLGHPIYYSGANGSSGHAFVCDGYDENDYMHFNFGWSGSADSYYSIQDVNGFNSGQAAVVNFIPMDIRADDNGIIYVSDEGEGNGSSWESATPLLEYASYLSSGGGVQVWVKAGTYYGDDTDPDNAFGISASNKVYGGFSGDEGPDFDLAQRDFASNPTILDGGGTKRVLNQANFHNAGSRAVWDGFIIQNGNSGSGAGVYLNDYTTLSNCIIRDNVSSGFGGGVYINSSSGTSQTFVKDCVITGNTASMGGGLCDRNSSVITNCHISNNTATTKGGGIYLYNTDKPNLRGCVISNNSAKNGGGLYARGKCEITNCDILMNEAIESYGGVFNENKYSTYSSCILWGNEANGQPNQNYGDCTFEYCAVQGGIDGEGNIDLPAENDGEEPGVFVRFIRPAEGVGVDYEDADWSLEPRSICLNAGKPGTAGYSFDINGDQRIQHGRVDIGAYEQNASLTLIEDYLDGNGEYHFNGRVLHEPGYYTTLYTMPECDSVVGLTLMMPVGLEEEADDAEVLSVELFTLLGQPLGSVPSPEALTEMRLKPGCYLLRIRTSEGIKTEKVILK